MTALNLKGVRGMIATRMVESLQTTAQLSYHTHVDASALREARAQWRAAGQPIGFEDLIINALVLTLSRHPTMNTVIKDGLATCGPDVHVCVATPTPTGLMAPALFDAHQKSVPEIAAARRDLIDRAARGRLSVAEMTGGTITISNLGTTRVEHFTPILNAGQVSLLGLGRITEHLQLRDGRLVTGRRLPLSLTADHRLIDGAPAGGFLDDLCGVLEGPQPLP